MKYTAAARANIPQAVIRDGLIISLRRPTIVPHKKVKTKEEANTEFRPINNNNARTTAPAPISRNAVVACRSEATSLRLVIIG